MRVIGRSLFAAALALSTSARTAEQPGAAPLELRISSGRLTLKAENLSVEDVLTRIARLLNAKFSVAGAVEQRTRSWNLQQVPLVEAIVQIARPASVLMVQDRDTQRSMDALVSEIHLIGGGDADTKPAITRTSPVALPVSELAGTLASAANPQIRREAALALGRIPTVESVRALERALSDADSSVRVEVIEALGRIGSDEAIRLVGQSAMSGHDAEVQAAATQVLEISTHQYARDLLLEIKSRAANAERAAPSRNLATQK